MRFFPPDTSLAKEKSCHLTNLFAILNSMHNLAFLITNFAFLITTHSLSKHIFPLSRNLLSEIFPALCQIY